ncbi:Uu.00g040830.m01.CDS01 [Anthostomella pinea]|uniref:Uu.00g040830.m01.CDS01 n=1 Tax=Anthostomella pinea TaxID=933095 RepID=A0AAI8VAA2_9PEZI|nr:Uu.00g040830.m01.CDS01 [Anthostomella pinea]
MGPFYFIAALGAGVLSHLAFFRVGEHHLHGMQYALTTIAACIVSIYVPHYFFHTSISTSASSTLALASCYFTGLYASLIIFRIFFHPLKNFPGPLGCKISSAWFATYLLKLDAFRQLQKLHQKNGPFLRIGSNDLSIAHPQAIQAVYGLGTRCRKAAWYDLSYPMVSLQTTRDNALHGRRRRLWSSAFGERNLRDYEKRTSHYRELLINAIEKSESRPMDVAKWFNLFTFDVMGDLAFGNSFQMLETSKEHRAIKLLNSGLTGLGFKLPMWFFRVMIGIPGLARDWWGFMKYCVQQLENRMKNPKTKVDTPDIMSCLLKPSRNKRPTGLDRTLLEGDSQLIVVAGSDTTSTTLTNIFRYLAEQPDQVDHLRAEIDKLPRSELGDYVPTDLADLKHLNGTVNESLRLYPPVPTALPRLTPLEGLTIDGTFIPGNVTVYCPQYVLGRSPECYIRPDELIPERWYSLPELLKDDAGFAPFSAGHYGCIAKPLALLNVRGTVARIVADYDVQVAPGQSLAEYDLGMTEHFTLAPPPLNLCFTKRVRSE